MSNLSVNGNNNVSQGVSQGVKKDSYDHWNSQYKLFMQKFGKQLDDKPALYETQYHLLTNMKRLALAEGRTKEASELDVKIIAVEAALPKQKPQQMQQVSAQQILAMQQGPKNKVSVMSQSEHKPPVPDKEELGTSEEWFVGWGENEDSQQTPVQAQSKAEELQTQNLNDKNDGVADISEETVQNTEERPEMPEHKRQFGVYDVLSNEVTLVSDVPYEKRVMTDCQKILQKSFDEKTSEEIMHLLLSEEDMVKEGKAPESFTDVQRLRDVLTGKPGQRSHFTNVCTSDLRSPIVKSRKDKDTIGKEFVELLTGPLSDYMDRNDIQRGYKTPEEIEERNAENLNNQRDAIKAQISKAEDEIVISFIKKYKLPGGKINKSALGIISGLRNKGYVPDNALLSLTEACMKKDGQADVRKSNAIVHLRQAGALTDEVLSIIDLIPRDESGKFDEAVLKDAEDLTRSVIGMPELGELLPQVKDKPAVKDSIVTVSQYYPHQKAQLQELIPLMLDEEGNEDKNAAVIVRDMARYMFPESQKWYAEKPEDMSIQNKNIENVLEATKMVLEASKDEGSLSVNPIAVDLLSVMAESSRGCEEMVEILDTCKDNNGKINENLVGIAGNLVSIGIEPGKIMSHLEKFMYKDGRIDDVGAKSEVETLTTQTQALRAKNEEIKKLQAEADEIRQKLQQRF